MKLALRIGVLTAAAFVASMLIWQGVATQGAPDPLRPNTSSTVAFLDIGILVFREGLECILVLAAVTASMTGPKREHRASRLWCRVRIPCHADYVVHRRPNRWVAGR